MSLEAMRALVNEIVFGTFSVDATVTRTSPDNVPIVTRAIWLRPVTEDTPHADEFTRSEQRRRLSIARSDVPTVPRGTLIDAAERDGAAVVRWFVDGHDRDRRDAYYTSVFVVPLQEPV